GLAAERKWTFPRSKPPGCLAFYRGITWLGDSQLGVGLGRLWAPSAPQIGRDERIAGVALTLFPVLTFATIFPLWGLVRLLAGSHEADLSTLLYAVTPSVLLVTNHLDAAVYPLCAVTSAALALWGTRERRPWATFAGGAGAGGGGFLRLSPPPAGGARRAPAVVRLADRGAGRGQPAPARAARGRARGGLRGRPGRGPRAPRPRAPLRPRGALPRRRVVPRPVVEQPGAVDRRQPDPVFLVGGRADHTGVLRARGARRLEPDRVRR